MQVDQFTVVRKCLKAVREAIGHQQCALIGCGKLFGVPLQKGGRFGAQIHRYVPDRATQTADEFHLGIWGMLKMQAANRALLLRESLIDLRDGFAPARSGEFVGAKQAREETAAIPQLLTFYDLQVSDRGIENRESAHDARLEWLAVS